MMFNDEVIIEVECPKCGQYHSVRVSEADFYDWQNGKMALLAFPYLSATEREQLISHLCPECQEKIFG